MRKPNVLVFFTDQQRWDTTGVHGNPMDLTPNFDRMARRGTHFVNTCTCQPVCGPARAVLQTGLHATNIGVWRNGIGLPAEKKTLAYHFREAGYHTGYIGKWHLYGGEHSGVQPYGVHSNDPVPREYQGGYDFWRGSNLLEFASDAYDLRLFDEEGVAHKYPGYRVDAQTDVAIRYIDDHKEEPFFLYLSYIEPHHQNHVDAYPAPTGYEERYRDLWVPPDLRALGGSSAQHLPGYYGMVKRLDEALGRIEDALRSLDLLENTVILFVSDHGNHFKTRNGEYKRSGHEASIRVPCMATGPGFEGGGAVSNIVSLVDIPPTLLDAAGIAIPDEMEGRSAVPATVSESTGAGAPWRDDVFVQISESCVGRAVRTKRWKYVVIAEGLNGGSVDAADTYTEAFLYDLKSDPYELRNLIGLNAYKPVADRMKERLLARIADVEGSEPRIVEAPAKPSGQAVVLPEEVNS